MPLPASPFALVQERREVKGDPWRVLVASACRAQVAGGADRVYPVLVEVLNRWPTDVALAAADERTVAGVVEPLGLQRRRAHRLVRMSVGYSLGWHLPPKTVEDLEGVGRYGADAWALFVEERTDVVPTDPELRRWLAWRLEWLGR